MKRAGVKDLRVATCEGDPDKKIALELARRERMQKKIDDYAKEQVAKQTDPVVWNGLTVSQIQQEYTAEKIIQRMIDERIKELLPRVRKHMEQDPEFPFDHDFKAPPIAFLPAQDKQLGAFVKNALIANIKDFHVYGVTIAEEIGCRYGIYQLGPKQTAEDYVVRWTSSRGGAKSAMVGDSIPNFSEMPEADIDQWLKDQQPRPKEQPNQSTTTIGERGGTGHS